MGCGVVLETTVCLNLPHGRWLSESWFVQLQECCKAYMDKADVQDAPEQRYWL